MPSVDLLIIHAMVVTQNEGRDVITDGAMAIQGGRIVALGKTEEVVSQYSARQTVSIENQIVFPGLVNTHTHLFQVATKGLGEDMPVQDWVEAVTAPTAIHITPEEMYIFCLTGCLELIHSGVTTLADMSYMAHTHDLHEQNIQAIMDSGLQGIYTTIISDFGEEYGVLPGLIKPIEWFIDVYERLLQQYKMCERLSIGIAIGAPWTVTDEGIHQVIKLADKSGARLFMHINENELDNILSQKRYKKNIVPYLDEIGFLRPDLLAIHCVVTDEEDIRLYRKNDVKISHNPVSNMYLGSGIAPIARMVQSGLTIGLGVDGAGSNNSQDMIETMKVAALLQKVSARDASVVDAQQVLDWATLGGAKALGLEKEIGSLEAGKRADFFVLSANSAKVVPIHDPVATLVYSAGEENVVMTVANGRILMRDRCIQHLDEQDVLKKCQLAASKLAERCGSSLRLKRKRVAFWK